MPLGSGTDFTLPLKIDWPTPAEPPVVSALKISFIWIHSLVSHNKSCGIRLASKQLSFAHTTLSRYKSHRCQVNGRYGIQVEETKTGHDAG